MTMSHGYPPPLVAAPVEEKPAPEQPVNASSLHNELRVISNAICELKAQQAATPRVEQVGRKMLLWCVVKGIFQAGLMRILE